MKLKLFGRVREIPDILIILLFDLILAIVLFWILNTFYIDTPYYQNFLVLSIFTVLLLPFVYFYLNYRRIREKEKYFPQFLKDLADAHRTGLSLVRAVYHISSHHYGPLTPHVKRLAIQMSWGVPFEDAFRKFAKETGSPMIESATLIILEAFSSGGKTADVLETVAEDFRILSDIKEERKSKFSPFVGTMYVVILISLGMSYILLNILLPDMSILPTFSLNLSPTQAAPAGVTTIPETTLKVLFLHMMLIEAVISGMLAGILGEGSWSAGIKHVLIMAFIVIIVFQLVIIPINPVERIQRALEKMPSSVNVTIDLGRIYLEQSIPRDAFDVNLSINFVKSPGCCEGIEVNEDGIFVKQPEYVNLKVVSDGKGSATIYVG